MPKVQVSVPVQGNETLVGSAPDSSQELQELWLALAARRWRSLVLVPVHPTGSTASLARALALAARDLGAPSVTPVVEGGREQGSALALVEGSADTSHVVVAIPPVLVEPRGVVLARRADAVVACVERGRTRLSDVRRTVELIGAERFLGYVLVR